MKEKLLSVVLPVYRTGHCLQELYLNLKDVLEELGPDYDHEIILVEDCGDDGAWELVKGLGQRDQRVRGFKHRLNYGQHAAIATGLSRARGDMLVVMDADLKDPPELIPRLLEKAGADGQFDIVLAERSKIAGSFFRKICSYIVRKGFPLYDRIPNGKHYGSYWLMTRKALPYYLEDPDRFRLSLKVLERIPLEIGFVRYNQVLSANQSSTYSFSKLVALFSKLIPEVFLQRVRAGSEILAALATVAVILLAMSAEVKSGHHLIFLCFSIVFALSMYCSAIFTSWVMRLRTGGELIAHTEVVESVDSGVFTGSTGLVTRS